MFALAMAIALGCDSPIERRVVGWSADGQTALVRTEHADAEGALHALKLELLASEGVTKTWVILAPEDEGSAAVRGKRWTAAEPEIAAAGIVLAPDGKPLVGEIGPNENLERQPFGLPASGIQLQVISSSFDGGNARRHQLQIVQEGVPEAIVKELAVTGNSAGEYAVGTVWSEPGRRSLVLLPSFGRPIAHLVSYTAISDALAADPR